MVCMPKYMEIVVAMVSKCQHSDRKHQLIAYNGIVENNGNHLTGVLPVDKEMIARVDSTLVETMGEPQAIPPPL